MRILDDKKDINIEEEWKKFFKDKKDGEVKNNLILQYLSLVKYIVDRMAISLPYHVDRDDLVSVGICGLIKAIDKYDPNLGTKFETYATIRIQGAIMDELRAMDWVPRSVREKARVLQRAYNELEEKLGHFATDDEVAAHLDISLEQLDMMIKESTPATMLSLNTVLRQQDDNRPLKLVDSLQDGTTTPLDKVAQKEVKEVLINALRDLSEQERRVIILYYYRELTLKEIGKVLNVSESRISQVHTKAVLRLRARLSKSIIRD